MKKLAIILLLCGCVAKSPTDNMVDTATQTIDIMYNAIPKECQNETLANLRATSKEQIKAINDACAMQKDALRAKIHEKNVIIFSLCLLILACVGANAFLKLHR